MREGREGGRDEEKWSIHLHVDVHYLFITKLKDLLKSQLKLQNYTNKIKRLIEISAEVTKLHKQN